MRAYSNDLRQRILRAVDQGHRQAEIAAAFQVSVSTIKRYLKQRRETGILTVKPIPGHPSKKGAALDADLGAQVAAHGDAPLEQHCQLWERTHGQRVSTATMSRALARLGLPRKKLCRQSLVNCQAAGPFSSPAILAVPFPIAC